MYNNLLMANITITNISAHKTSSDVTLLLSFLTGLFTVSDSCWAEPVAFLTFLLLRPSLGGVEAAGIVVSLWPPLLMSSSLSCSLECSFSLELLFVIFVTFSFSSLTAFLVSSSDYSKNVRIICAP